MANGFFGAFNAALPQGAQLGMQAQQLAMQREALEEQAKNQRMKLFNEFGQNLRSIGELPAPLQGPMFKWLTKTASERYGFNIPPELGEAWMKSSNEERELLYEAVGQLAQETGFNPQLLSRMLQQSPGSLGNMMAEVQRTRRQREEAAQQQEVMNLINQRAGQPQMPQMPGGRAPSMQFVSALPERMQLFAPVLLDEAGRQGVDPVLALAVMQVESGGNPQAVSPKGAQGLMQLMPGTARELGVDPRDPAQNIRGGVTYLKQQLDRFGGNVMKAVSAYNAGPGAIEEGRMPAETRQYIKLVQQQYQKLAGLLRPESGSIPGMRAGDDIAQIDALIAQKTDQLNAALMVPGSEQIVGNLLRDRQQLLQVREGSYKRATPSIGVAERTVLASMGLTPENASPQQIEEARARALQQRQEVPLLPEQSAGMIHEASLRDEGLIVFAPVGLTPSQLREQGFRHVSPKNIEGLSALAPVETLTADLKGLTDQLITATDTQGAYRQYARLNIEVYQRGTAASTYDDVAEAFIGQISRGLAREVGALTDRDISRVRAALPKFSDTRSIADAKWKIIGNLLETARNEAIRKSIGDKPGAKRPAVRGRIDSLLNQLDKVSEQAPEPAPEQPAVGLPSAADLQKPRGLVPTEDLSKLSDDDLLKQLRGGSTGGGSTGGGF
jgi:Transglycosylase SLT domain